MSRMLRVCGRPYVLVPDPRTLGTNPPRFIGKKPNPSAPPDAPLAQRFVDCCVEIEDSPFIREAVRFGELGAADDATAQFCGVQRVEDA